MSDLFTGKLVRLAALDPEEASKYLSKWGRDSEYKRLLDFTPPRLYSVKASKDWVENQMQNNPAHNYWFVIRSLEGDLLLGDIELEVITWGSRDAFVGIGIGERDFWGRGYGTEALELALRFAFSELNLRRVTLNVMENNQRAIRSYENAGFRIEGRERQSIQRDGLRWDVLFMGILREEWMEKNERK